MQYVRILAAACLLLGPALASAQSAPAPGNTSASTPADRSADPLDPGAAVPPLPSPNVLAGYIPFQAQPVAPWRQTNEQVAPAARGTAPAAGTAMPMPASSGSAGAVAPASGGHHQHH
ncbi:hypothetical protein ACKI2N_028145 [Cupriavidus sp. 30B13]|uniref:hypothetical protein n=1 Tax=Cupriavidus sp. 30B13 TaxID=3384241 RepID=UPI003B90CB50